MRTIGELKQFLVTKGEPEIHATKDSLSSDVIACVVKLMSNEELIAVGAKVFNSLPHSKIGANGYLGARIQPDMPSRELARLGFILKRVKERTLRMVTVMAWTC